MGNHHALRKAAREMRDVYANEIARAVHAGQQPQPLSLESWARYDAQAKAEKPCEAIATPGAVGEKRPSARSHATTARAFTSSKPHQNW